MLITYSFIIDLLSCLKRPKKNCHVLHRYSSESASCSIELSIERDKTLKQPVPAPLQKYFVVGRVPSRI